MDLRRQHAEAIAKLHKAEETISLLHEQAARYTMNEESTCATVHDIHNPPCRVGLGQEAQTERVLKRQIQTLLTQLSDKQQTKHSLATHRQTHSRDNLQLLPKTGGERDVPLQSEREVLEGAGGPAVTEVDLEATWERPLSRLPEPSGKENVLNLIREQSAAVKKNKSTTTTTARGGNRYRDHSRETETRLKTATEVPKPQQPQQPQQPQKPQKPQKTQKTQRPEKTGPGEIGNRARGSSPIAKSLHCFVQNVPLSQQNWTRRESNQYLLQKRLEEPSEEEFL